MMVMGQILRQLKASELVAGGNSSNHARSLKIGEMTIGGTPRNVGIRVRNVRNAHRVAERCQQFDNGATTRGVSLIDSSKMYFNEFVKIFY